jgi:hypothetical protein
MAMSDDMTAPHSLLHWVRGDDVTIACEGLIGAGSFGKVYQVSARIKAAVTLDVQRENQHDICQESRQTLPHL